MANPDAARKAPENLAKRQRHFEEGHKGALLNAIAVAAYAGVPLPEWAAEAFLKAYHDVATRKLYHSWDDVFGEPHPRGSRLNDQRRKEALALRVFERVRELRKHDGVAIDDGMWETVAPEFGISAGTVKNYYYFALEWNVMRPGNMVPGVMQPAYLKTTKRTSKKSKKA
jgi:hypothetical protein